MSDDRNDMQQWSADDWASFALWVHRTKAAIEESPYYITEGLEIIEILQGQIPQSGLPRRIYYGDIVDSLIELSVAALQKLRTEIKNQVRGDD